MTSRILASHEKKKRKSAGELGDGALSRDEKELRYIDAALKIVN